MVVTMVMEHGVSYRQACKEVSISRTTVQYQHHPKDDTLLIEELQLLVEQHPAIGFWQCYYRIRRKGLQCNHKRLYRVYTTLRLNIRRRSRRRLPSRTKRPLYQPLCINEVWSIDFMNDTLFNGRRFRLLNIVDDYNREYYILRLISLYRLFG